MSRLVKLLTSTLIGQGRRRPVRQYCPLQFSIKTPKRFYSQNENLLNRLHNGTITKSEVQKLILNDEYLNRKVIDLNTTNRIMHGPETIMNNTTTATQNPTITLVKNRPNNNNNNNNFNSKLMSLGLKSNPIYMRKQATLRELLFGLFPFIFLFWMVGAFDFSKGRKQGELGGTTFTKNFSEFDETDWEDEEEEQMEDEAHFDNLQQYNDNLINNNDNPTNDNNKIFEISNNDIYNSKKNENVSTQFKNDKHNNNNNDNNNNNNTDNNNNNNNNTKQTMDDKKHQNNDKRRKQKRVRFKNVCGCEEAKADLMDLVDYLRNPEKYQALGCKLPKGVLMSGSPGTGKTLLARALAGEAGVPFLATNGSSFDEIYVGVGVQRVHKLFERAKELAPCIVFIDEIDAIGNTRMQVGNAHSSDSLNALLCEMDGFERNTGIIVIAATNMPDRLDDALVRPGRFDRKVHIPLPDKQAREQIIKLYLKDHADSDVDTGLLVSDISGFSGAELESMVNLASIESVKKGEIKVSMKNLIEAKEIISMGRARSTLDISPLTKKITAYHESGHAIVSLFTRGTKPIYKATILPRGDALGFVASSNNDEFMSTKQSLLAELDVCMGGRAAEEIFNGNAHITTGASSDFGHATRIATAMVCQYGMSPRVGKVSYRMEDLPRLSPTLQNVINEEVKRLLDESYHRASSIIEDHKEEVHTLANTLLSKETLSGDEIKKLVQWNEDRIREPIDFITIKDNSFEIQELRNNLLNPQVEFLNPKINTSNI